MKKKPTKVLFVVNADWVFLQHRVPFSEALIKKNVKLKVVCKETGRENEIRNLGIETISVNFSRRGLNVFNEFLTILRLIIIIVKENPDVVFNLTIKPVLYGTLVSRVFSVNVINIICGLGYMFTDQSNRNLRQNILKLYKKNFNYDKEYTVFENEDDLDFFLKKKILKPNSKYKVVNGVGVNLDIYNPIFNNNESVASKLTVLLPTRMLWNKGVQEFIEVAKLLERDYSEKVYFKLIGKIDEGNPESIPISHLEKIEIEGYLKWEGFKIDMISEYANSDIVVLPSYYGEGLPTVLAEACAMGLPIVTTNSVGCKECVDEGVNGFKVPIKSIKELAEAIEKLIISKELRDQFGKASRIKAEKEFDQKQIIKQYVDVFEKMINES